MDSMESTVTSREETTHTCADRNLWLTQWKVDHVCCDRCHKVGDCKPATIYDTHDLRRGARPVALVCCGLAQAIESSAIPKNLYLLETHGREK